MVTLKQEVNRISQKRVVKSVVSLGLTESEAEVYVYLAKQGSQTAREIAEALKTHRQLVYRSLRRLKNRDIVNATAQHPSVYCAIPFDKALELLIKAHLKESLSIEQQKEEIIDQWRYMTSEQLRL